MSAWADALGLPSSDQIENPQSKIRVSLYKRLVSQYSYLATSMPFLEARQGSVDEL
jgi:hypothetical protein